MADMDTKQSPRPLPGPAYKRPAPAYNPQDQPRQAEPQPMRMDQDLLRGARGFKKGGAAKMTMKDFEGSAADRAQDRKGLAAENRKRGFATGGSVTKASRAPSGVSKVDEDGPNFQINKAQVIPNTLKGQAHTSEGEDAASKAGKMVRRGFNLARGA
jgi:hypothetical protein